MSRIDCICNRNIKIIATYVNSKLGSFQDLFDGCPYPYDEYASARDFFLNEDEWTSFENFEKIFRTAKELVNEDNFYFRCGASSTKLHSWGRFYYFATLFVSPSDGYKRLPFFNKNSNDTKEIEVVVPPTKDLHLKKIRTIIKIKFHEDFSPNRDYIGDGYLRGIVSSIPSLWGLPPASIKQIMNAYNPELLFNQELDFIPYNLDVKIKENKMTLLDPVDGKRRIVGEKILLEPDMVRGKKVFLGKHSRLPKDYTPNKWEKREAIHIISSVQVEGHNILNKGDIYDAPYFILEIIYERSSFSRRFFQIFKFRKNNINTGQDMFETIDQLRRSIRAKNSANLALEKTNSDLSFAKSMLDKYAKELEDKVEKRTMELQNVQQDLVKLNRQLEAKVQNQVVQLERYNDLRRYLSPKLTDEILSGGHTLGAKPKRKIMTVVFTDIRGFSALADSLEPEELFQLLDKYLSEMISIIHKYDGTLNKIMGDGLLIFFGDPVQMDDHYERAVHMSIDMQKRISDLKHEWLAYGHELGIGIGINTAYMTVGNIGSDMHRDYTVIGNQVNVAARLESQAKAGQILISQRTYSKVKNIVSAEDIGFIKVKGIHEPIKTHNIIWEKYGLTQKQL